MTSYSLNSTSSGLDGPRGSRGGSRPSVQAGPTLAGGSDIDPDPPPTGTASEALGAAPRRAGPGPSGLTGRGDGSAVPDYPGPAVRGWWLASYVVLWLMVAVLAVLVVALARQVGMLHLRLGPRGALEVDDEGPPLGEAPPPVTAADLTARPITVGGPGRPQVLLFVSPDCPLCRDVLPSLPAVARALDGMVEPLVVADAAPGDAAGAFPSGRADGAPVVASAELARAYAVPGTPYVVVLDRMGVVRAKGTVNSLEQMEGLVDTARRRLADDAPTGRAG